MSKQTHIMTIFGFLYIPVHVNDRGWKPAYRNQIVNTIAGAVMHGALVASDYVESLSGGAFALPIALVETGDEGYASPGKPENPDVGATA